MEQIFYIILELAREKNHVRGIAKKLNINHMTSSRILKDLYEKNVIDFEKKGRNKVYHIKNTEEARNYLVMAEIFKLNEIIKKYPVLRKIAKQIQQKSKFNIVLLFGSYAKKKATKKSDIDIFIKTNKKNVRQEIQNINTKISVKIGELNNSPLSKEIKKDHVILKGAEQYYDKYFFDKTS
ncbi:hypothetical protein GF327_09300 [Candidatus Woesearchaeota archaeon]|nr:hypothetical protein [Candidatus Woesearchaeota archaeon]